MTDEKLEPFTVDFEGSTGLDYWLEPPVGPFTEWLTSDADPDAHLGAVSE